MRYYVDSSFICVVVLVLVIAFVANPAMTSNYHSDGPLTRLWNIEVVDSEGAVGRWCSHEIDVFGQVLVAYLDNSNFNLKYAKFDGSQWTNETVDDTGNAWSGMSLALDSWRRPHISYVDTNYFLKYAQWSGSAWSWETVISVGPSTGLGVDTSLAFDSFDVPHIAYLETDTGDFVVASKPSGWVFETVDTPGHEYWVALEIDSSDTPHVAYMNSTLEDLVYATRQGVSWMTETVDTDGAVGFMPSIALNASSSPRIAYWDFGNDQLKYAEKNGSFWDVEVVDTFGTAGMYPSLQVDEMGNPGIAYHDGQSRDLRYAWNSGGDWSNESVDTEGSVGYFASLEYDTENQPTIAYLDMTKGDLKFAWGPPSDRPDLSVANSDIVANPPGPVANGTIVHINATIHNLGTANASNVIVRFFDDAISPLTRIGGDNLLTEVVIGGNATCGIDWPTSYTGMHRIFVVIDQDDEIAELNETNNLAYFDILVMSSHPSPPSDVDAELTGFGLQDVTISWQLSADDGGGENSVVGYQVLRGSDYEPNGLGYSLLDSVPSGSSSYVDSMSGEGDTSSYFYKICSENTFGNLSCAEGQSGKYTEALAKGVHLVSIPLVTANNSVASVLQTVRFDMIWVFENTETEACWKSYHQAKSYDHPFVVNHTVGFWIDLTTESNLTVAGKVPLTTGIRLLTGWNLVGYPSWNSSYSVDDLAGDTGAVRVERYDSLQLPFMLSVMSPSETFSTGLGYWVLLTTEVVWTVRF